LTVEALWTADRRSFAPAVCVQSLYNLLDRSAERELVPACARHGLSLVPYSPLAGGVLTGKYARGEPPPPGTRAAVMGRTAGGRPGHIPLLNEHTLAAAERLTATAAELGLSASQAAIAWTLHQPQVTSVILGASSVAQLQETLPAADARLDAEALTRVAESVSPANGPRPAQPQASA
jgi:aryl-alcohol dehydrogenase-like predicted oxidoreductase